MINYIYYISNPFNGKKLNIVLCYLVSIITMLLSFFKVLEVWTLLSKFSKFFFDVIVRNAN